MKEKYAKITFKILICIPLLFSIFLIDQLVVPQKITNDEIIAYGRIEISRKGKYSTTSSKHFVGYKFLTKKGLEFSIRETFIEENEITIGQSYIFQNINSVKSKNNDYSDKLMSGLNGACFYFSLSLAIISTISLLMLKFNKNLSDNGFQNIILINSFVAFLTLYIYVMNF